MFCFHVNSLHAEVIYTSNLAKRKLPAISVVILKVEADKCGSKPCGVSVA